MVNLSSIFPNTWTVPLLLPLQKFACLSENSMYIIKLNEFILNLCSDKKVLRLRLTLEVGFQMKFQLNNNYLCLFIYCVCDI